MNFLNLDTLVEGDDYRVERKLFWVYLWLLIFEGALRKWILPGLSTPLLLVREPIVIYAVIRAMIKGYVRHPLVFAMIGVSTISLICTFLWGHHDFLVGLFGWRIYFFHFPFMFVIGTVLTRDDLLKILRFILYVSIPMTVLVVLQFYSPQTAWVNRGIGGEGSAGFSGALGYARPPGTFSFTSGYVAFQGVVCAALLYYIVENKNLSEGDKMNPIILGFCAACYLISIPTSISRSHMVQTAVFLLFLTIAAVRRSNLRTGYTRFVVVIAFAVIILLGSGVINKQIDAMSVRFEKAADSEGGFVEGAIGNRMFGGYSRALTKSYERFPFLGYGIGLGTNAGAKMMGGNMYSFGFNAENEWQRILGESGFVLGLLIVFVRLILAMVILARSYVSLADYGDVLPWILSCGVLLTLPSSQWGVPTNLGICVLFAGLALAAINTSIR